MKTTVLVHGAWLGGWCWSRVHRRLASADHRVYTPTLTGMGERAHLAGHTVDLETHIQDICNVITCEGLHDVTLVGHSFSGLVVSGVVDRLPQAVSHLVYLDALLPTDGLAAIDAFSPNGQLAVKAEAQAWSDGAAWPLPADIDDMSVMTDFSEEDRRWFTTRATPHPLASYTQPLTLTAQGDTTCRKTYILCTRDRPSPPDFIAGLHANDRWHVATLDAGHWPMITQPAALASLLMSLDTPP